MNEFFSIALLLAALWFSFMQINCSEAFAHKHWILGSVFMCTLIVCTGYNLTNTFG